MVRPNQTRPQTYGNGTENPIFVAITTRWSCSYGASKMVNRGRTLSRELMALQPDY